MTEIIDAAANAKSGGFHRRNLDPRERGQGNRKNLRQRYPSIFSMFWILIVGCMVLFRLIAETGLVRNLLALTKKNEQLYNYNAREDEGCFVHTRTHPNHTVLVSLSDCEESENESELAHSRKHGSKNQVTAFGNRPSRRVTSTVLSGSTFQTVPSATNLLSPLPQTREQHRSTRCYETSFGDAFHDKSHEEHDYSHTNYVLHVLGGGTCHRDTFGSFPLYSSKNTIVTAYYEIPSKHPPGKYHDWMGNFLSVYRDPMVIFTSPNMVEILANLRHHSHSESCEPPCGPSSFNYFDTIIVALPLEELPIAKLYPKSFWVDQLDRDPQSAIHSPFRGDPRMQGKFESGELYWIWLSKIWFVTEATRIRSANAEPKDSRLPSFGSANFSNSDTTTTTTNNNNNSTFDHSVFAWIDIGSFRNEDLGAKKEVPSPLLLRHPEVVPATEILFWSHSSAHSHSMRPSNSTTNMKKYPTKDYTPIAPRKSPYFDDKTLGHSRYFFHAGAHFAGRPRSISRFHRRFLQTIDVFVERNLTLADDQAVMQSACLSYFEGHGDDIDVRVGVDFDDDGCNKVPDNNVCAYATRNMVGGKSKWFGLTKLLQNGWAKSKSNETESKSKSARWVARSGDPCDSYWRPPPPGYYLEHVTSRRIDPPFNRSTSSR